MVVSLEPSETTQATGHSMMTCVAFAGPRDNMNMGQQAMSNLAESLRKGWR